VAAFAVGSVVGVAQLESSAIDDLPSLVADADTDQGIVAAIGKVDADLFLILELARAIPESDWLEWDLPEVTS
jgi:chemotaxis signal transduction protein